MSKIQPTTPIGVKFASAGLAACTADIATFPFDTAKVRLQIQGEDKSKDKKKTGKLSKPKLKYRGLTGTILTMCREEGPRSLYNGLAPGLQRQIVFASIRIGLYEDVKKFYSELFTGDENKTTVPARMVAGVTTGAIAISCAQPTDVVKVRMQAAARGGGAAIRYKSSLDAYKTISRTEGIKGLWKGLLPNITRNGIVNAAELVTYDLVKETILHNKLLPDNVLCHFTSAISAGFVATVVASPVDVVKTRFMNSPTGAYSGATNCAVEMFKRNGITAFYKGFFPSFVRLGSWNIVMFMCFERFKVMLTSDPDATAAQNTFHVATPTSNTPTNILEEQVHSITASTKSTV